jgi:hypothetical protein
MVSGSGGNTAVPDNDLDLLYCRLRARVFGRCEPSTGIKPFTALVDQVMQTLAAQILAFEQHYSNTAMSMRQARPFDWKCTHTDLNQLPTRCRTAQLAR